MSFEKQISKNNNSNKKGGFVRFFLLCLLILAFLIIIFLIIAGKDKNKENTENISSSVVSTESRVESTENREEGTVESKDESLASSSKMVSSKTVSPAAGSSSIPVNETAYIPNGDWRLVIANKVHLLPKSYNVDVAYASGNYRLDKRIIEPYKQMIAAAKSEGISLNIISGYRTYEGQVGLYNKKVNSYKSQGYSEEKAKELAALYVAPPGTSEHLTGLAADIISPDWYSYNSDLNEKFELTKQFKWLYLHCAEYGFILRYPKDKEGITQIEYEPWHYRYVGVEAAKEIMSRGICLEEYVDGLQ